MTTDHTDHPSREDFISIGEPDLTDAEIEAVREVLRKGWLTRGPQCEQFEKEFCQKVQARQALAVNSCTAALHLALLVHQIGGGDEVIVPSLTFAATAEVVVHCGATPVFADIEESTYCMDPAHVETLVNDRTKAIVTVHYAGHPANLGALRRIARQHGIPLIEDAAHALGARHEEQPIGAYPSLACFSFYPNKNITTGEGGMLVTGAPELDELARKLSLHGMDGNAWKRFGSDSKWRYEITHIGYKYNAHEMLAALGRVQLKRLDSMQAKREKIWDFYQEMFHDDSRVICPPCQEWATHAHHLYVLTLSDEARIDRDQLVNQLRKKGIGATVHYDPLHLQPVYRERLGTRAGMLPVTEKIAARILSLPLHSHLTLQQVNQVATEVLRLV